MPARYERLAGFARGKGIRIKWLSPVTSAVVPRGLFSARDAGTFFACRAFGGDMRKGSSSWQQASSLEF
jgi:hypothetical protein